MKVIVIYNPVAGIMKRNESKIIEKFLNENDFNYQIFQTTTDEGPYEILSKLNNDCGIIITCGGDGTVSETIRGMHNFSHKCNLLIVPIGTSNEIAQNLGLKDDNLINILNRLFTEDISTLDYGLLNDNHTFTYALTFGNFTDVTYETPQKMKNWLGFQAYILYALLSFRKVETYNIKIKSEKVNINGNYLFGAISNSATIGNIIHYDKETISLSDGEFEVLLISKPRNLKEIRLLVKGLIQNDYDNEAFTTFKTDKLTIESKDNIKWNTDGELAGSYKSMTVENINKKINLIV